MFRPPQRDTQRVSRPVPSVHSPAQTGARPSIGPTLYHPATAGALGSAPPVYWPTVSSALQQRPRVPGSAPPVYRPQAIQRQTTPAPYLPGVSTAAQASSGNSFGVNRPAPPVYRPTGRIRCAQLPVRRQARRLRFTKLHGQLWRWRFSRKALLRQECRGAKSRYGNFLMAEPTGSHGFDPTEFTGVPIIIEVPVPAKDVEAARDKVNRLVGTGRHRTQAVAFVFEVNSRLTIDSKNKDDFKVSTVSDHTANAKLAELNAVCRALAAHMESNGLFGGCFPMVFVPTGPEGGYTFPFLESRSILTRHTGVQLVHQAMRELAKEVGFPPVVRGMDNDVSQDPLLNLPEKAPEVPEGTPEVEKLRG
jgi:hypothetical protein